MATFKEANNVRIALKMKLSVHSWYCSSSVVTEADGYSVVIVVKRLDNQIRKHITPVVSGVSVKAEIE